MNRQTLIHWLLDGDVSIQYQTYKYLLNEERPDLQARIATEGWGAHFLAQRLPHGHWGGSFYQPKWISSHYTLLDLRYLEVEPSLPIFKETIDRIADNEKSEDGGVNVSRSIAQSDVCVNGMFLTYACYFGIELAKLESVIDFILTQRLPDGGFNCRFNRSGAKHSSLHSTISMLEGIAEYERQGYTYRLAALQEAAASARAFILMHRFFRSDRTGEIIHKRFLRMPFPSRWFYDYLRALVYFAAIRHPWDDRMQEAIDLLLKKRNKDGTWNVNAKYSGLIHFEMEKAGKPSRWNTLRALRVLQEYGN
jgi:hypothetical protein